MAKRIFLFIAVNILVVLTVSITLQVLGIGGYLSAQGINYEALLIFCAVWGFAGAFISLLISRMMAKLMMGVQVINPSAPGSDMERELVQTVHRLAQRASLPAMPEVGIYASPEVNAFATGPSKRKALVAVSSGLLDRMEWRAVEGVLGHEVAHIANGDMVTMTLIQGVVNTFVMFFARVAAWALGQAISRNQDDDAPSPMVNFIAVIVFEILFSLLGAVVVAYFSRRREFRADQGSSEMGGREKMIYALESLKSSMNLVDTSQGSIATLKISGGTKGFLALLSTHPSLDARIAALKQG